MKHEAFSPTQFQTNSMKICISNMPVTHKRAPWEKNKTKITQIKILQSLIYLEQPQ